MSRTPARKWGEDGRLLPLEEAQPDQGPGPDNLGEGGGWEAGEGFGGRCDGSISMEIKGEDGFGYDPIFIPDESESRLTFAEMTAEEKSALSHRGRALRALFDFLNDDGA